MVSLKERLQAAADGDFSQFETGVPTGIPAFNHEEMKRCVQALQRLVQRSQGTMSPSERCQVAAFVLPLIL
ncbi:hypothetical protein [Denitratisoma oestradiolicum]|uniref:Uncharacterized protein n=1 Tax=Denitratisoma oestradiolicum TaxID=311182 RepID=A0A6S6XXV6_9PROT|nr:hypothetical protein [Denitratisoma oestradiolicum]CAB1369175.1 conserved protein of unknown function [Denitratisoma oestradiolicum]